MALEPARPPRFGPELWDFLQRLREPIQELMVLRAATIPALAPLLAQQGTPEALAREARSQELTRRALVENDWQPYLEDLRTQGRVFAQMGMTLPDWYSLLEGYRTVLMPALVAEYHDRPIQLGAALIAVDAFVDRAMSALGTAYVEECERMVRTAERERDIYAKLFAASPLGLDIWRHVGGGVFEEVVANPMVERLRRAPARLPEARIAELRSELFERMATALATDQPVEWAITPDPSVSFQVWLVKLDDEHVGQIIEDVTAIRTATRKLEWSVSELERSNRDLDQFAYVASHDLKAPLRDIDNLSRWLVEDLGRDLPEASAGHVARLRDRVARMERLLDDLLEYSRAGRVTGPSQRFDVAEAVSAACALAGAPPGFSVRQTSASLTVYTPRPPFELVLRNVIANAIKHHDRPDGAVEVRWTRRDPLLEVTVEDDGPGIPPAFHERVFTMFQTLRPRDQVEGSGMGLAIVRKVVEAFGGSVAIRSDGRRGTTLTFTWPLELPEVDA